MEFKNNKEILEEREKLIIRKKALKKELQNTKTNKINANFRNKKYWTEVIKIHENAIEETNQKINELENYIVKLSTFPEEILLPFIVECINTYECEEYENSKILLNFSVNFLESSYYNYVSYNLLYPKLLSDSIRKIENSFFLSKNPIMYQKLFEHSDLKCIMIPSTYEKNLLSKTVLNEYFKIFPYFEEISYNLIDRRLMEPEKKLEEILNDELESIKSEKMKKTKHRTEV